jgi:uncharacterized membrane protein HdeD (DUF308 family)
MMKWLKSPLLWGSLLIVAGVLFLIQEIFKIQLGSIFWGALLGLAGIFFVLIYINNRLHWWALIPGLTLIGVGLATMVDVLVPGVGDILGGLFVLGGIGAGFISVYLSDRRQWWAIIPAGVMITLAAISVLDSLLSDLGSGGLIFFGLGITVAVLALLPSEQGKMRWAWIPAIALVVIGLLITAAAEEMLLYLGPAALILGGIFILLRAFSSRR